MKQLIKISFLFIMLFLAIPVFAEGDMGAGGGNTSTTYVKVPESTVITKSLDSANQEEDAFGSFISWISKQLFELID